MPKQILKKVGPSLTASLGASLCSNYGISPTAARKRIQRAIANREILILKNFNFAHNQSFVFLAEHRGTKLYTERLVEAFEEAKSPLRLSLAAIDARGGVIPEYLFSTFSGLPAASDRKQDSHKAKKLLLDLEQIIIDGQYIRVAASKPTLTPVQINARVKVENVFLKAFAQWLQRQRLIGNQLSLRDPKTSPQFGYYHWDLVAPSYISPLLTYSKTVVKPGYIVADVIFAKEMKEQHIQYFIEKCKNIRVHMNNRPFMAFLISRWFTKEALNEAQSNGIVVATPKTLFGRHFSDALESFEQLLEQKDHEIQNQARIVDSLMKLAQHLDMTESLYWELRDSMFELIVGHCFQKARLGTVLHGKHFPDSAKLNLELNCDVLQLVPGYGLWACECIVTKQGASVSLEQTVSWFKDSVPRIRALYGTDNYPYQEFSLWTTGKIDSNAIQYLQALSTQADCKVSFKSAEDVAFEVENKADAFIKTLFQNWFKPRTT